MADDYLSMHGLELIQIWEMDPRSHRALIIMQAMSFRDPSNLNTFSALRIQDRMSIKARHQGDEKR